MAENDPNRERDEGRDESELKVTDRRLFDATGQLRGELPEEEQTPDDTAAAEAAIAEEPQETRNPEGQGFEHRSLDEPEGVDFTMLLNAMAQPALIFLGEIPHPGTGRPEPNMEQAKLQIDLLDLLRIKCRGNLTHEEEGLLDRMLYQLRMLYVSRSSQPPPAP